MNLHRNISRAILSLALLYAAPSAYPTTLSASAFVSRNIRDVSTCRPTTSWTFFFFFFFFPRFAGKDGRSVRKISPQVEREEKKNVERASKEETILKRILKRAKNQAGREWKGEKREKKEEKDTNRIPIISPLIQTSNRGRYRVVSYRGVSKRRKKKSKGGKRKISRRDI